MKYKTVEEMTSKFTEELDQESKFEKKLMEKYPTLFNEVDGRLVSPDCGISCPKGWEKIVDDLCGAIHERTTQVTRYQIKKGYCNKIKWKLTRLISKFKSRTYRLLNPHKGIKLMKFHSPKEEELAKAKKKLPYKIYIAMDHLIGKLSKDLYENVPASPPVKIGQVKEKFGTLRFYYDGGDDHIAGMVDLAEYISSKTCQYTGKEGSLCVKGKGYAWYATLSPKKAKELDYKVVK